MTTIDSRKHCFNRCLDGAFPIHMTQKRSSKNRQVVKKKKKKEKTLNCIQKPHVQPLHIFVFKQAINVGVACNEQQLLLYKTTFKFS